MRTIDDPIAEIRLLLNRLVQDMARRLILIYEAVDALAAGDDDDDATPQHPRQGGRP